ncbi:MAG: type ISP restriction/modification enzyme, partial [Candidatus Poribacteria bacterium]
DNPTFRGMRQSLMKSFDEIYILDLHGNSLKKEKCSDGSKDENVFDIMPGVAISIFIKRKNGSKDCKVYHSELWGTRESKYSWLMTHDKASTDWKELSPKSEFYLFIPRDESLSAGYEKYPKIPDIFPINSVGIVTARDGFVIDQKREDLEKRIGIFRDENRSDDYIEREFKLKIKTDKKLHNAREKLIKDENWKNFIKPILYRPFDIQWIFYNDGLIERSRIEVMRHMLKDENLGLITARSNKSNHMDHFFCSDKIMETKCGESTTQSYIFPLYLCQNNGDSLQKQPNINSRILDTLSGIYEKEPTPEEILYYIYSVLYSNTYRKKYAEFLRIDFPRVPFTKDYKLFSQMAGYGKRLVDLHLLESDEQDPPIAKYQGKGDDIVEKPRYDEGNGYVYINKSRYFEGVNKEVWAYYIGGYQVCDKWLKDRKGRQLSLDEMKHYCRIVTTLQKTIEIQQLIDKVYPEVEREVMEFGA